MTERIKYEYSVIIEADVNDDIQHQHLSEELEAYFNTYKNKVVLGDYQFRIHELPAKSNNNLSEITPDTSYAAPENKDFVVINLPEGSNLKRYQEMTHDSEGC